MTSTPSAVAAPAQTPSLTNIKRSKPLKYAYEKEIVLYALHKKLDYFSTECIYSPEAFRGSARTLIKNLEAVRPSAILDVVRSGEDMAKLVPGYEDSCAGKCAASTAMVDEEEAGCGSAAGRSGGGEMSKMEEQLSLNQKADEESLETEIKLPAPTTAAAAAAAAAAITTTTTAAVPIRAKGKKVKGAKAANGPQSGKPVTKQTMGSCENCGYLSSQKVCKACVLLDGLNKNRPRVAIETSADGDVTSMQQAREELPKVVAQMSIDQG
jgi:cytoplasmic tRNA 2-thiolation protein 1